MGEVQLQSGTFLLPVTVQARFGYSGCLPQSKKHAVSGVQRTGDLKIDDAWRSALASWLQAAPCFSP